MFDLFLFGCYMTSKMNKVPVKRHINFAIYLALTIITLSVYYQVHTHEFVNFDDDVYIYNNGYVLNGLTLEGIRWAFGFKGSTYWHPLTWLSLMLDAQFAGKNPAGYHMMNLFLHIVSTLLLFFILHRTTKSMASSAFVAALFALHPLNVESVAWATERKNALSTVFWMLTVLSYVFYTDKPGFLRYCLVFVSLSMGLMAKPFLVTIPFVFLLLDFWPLGRLAGKQYGIPGNSTRVSFINKTNTRSYIILFIEKLPLMVISFAVVYLTSISIERYNVLTEAGPFIQKLFTSLLSYVEYIKKMLWPSHLAVYYPYPSHINSGYVLFAGLFLLAITFFAVKKAFKAPYLLVGWLWYLGTAFPMIGLVLMGLGFIADRFGYVPLIGLFIMIAWGIPDALKRWRYRTFSLSVLAVLSLSACMVTTWFQVRTWADSGTLFRHAVSVTKDNYIAHVNLGMYYFEQGNIDEAIMHYRESLRIKPDYALAHNNLGAALLRVGKIDEAVEHLRKAIFLYPVFSDAHYNLGTAYLRLNKTDEAIEQFTEALVYNSGMTKAHNNLGAAFLMQNRLHDAIDQCSLALRIDPNSLEAYGILGMAYERQGNYDEAAKYYTRALTIARLSGSMDVVKRIEESLGKLKR